MIKNDRIEMTARHVSPALPYADNTLEPVISANTLHVNAVLDRLLNWEFAAANLR